MLTIRLLGRPAIERDGQPVRAPRGKKAWALLCYLALAQRPVSRRHLAELLFHDASDPLGALRWTLAELRRSLGLPGAFTGDPIATTIEGATVDLLSASSLDGELLEGVDLPSNAEFESWLLVARHRVSAAIEANAHETAVAALAAGRPGEAIEQASRALARNPLDEGNHELLVRSLAMAGDRAAALRQIAVCEDLLRRELGVTASPALREAANVATGSPMGLPLGGRAAAASQLEAGRAAIVAGAVDAGVQCLRRAVAEAGNCGDVALQARALAALGGALVHAARGRDEEGALVLHEAIQLATRVGDRATSVLAHRELGFVEVQAGRRPTAEHWLTEAQAMAETDEELAAILGVRGQNASDMGDYPSAFALLGESVDRARGCGDQRQEAWSLSLVGRAHLLRGETSQAGMALARSVELTQDQRWMAFLPWPLVLSADLAARQGAPDAAAETLERAWVLACQVGDPCWEGVAARGLGLLHAARGDSSLSAQWLSEATVRVNRVPDRYQWMHAHVLDAAVATALDQGDVERAQPLIGTLAPLAARGDMRELVVRAHVHRHRLGDPAALASARLLATHIDNPALADLF